MVFIFTIISCDFDADEYLDRYPLDAITDADFWKTSTDLELYVNQFYTMLPDFGSWGIGYLEEDKRSDNMVHDPPDNRLAGLNLITTNNEQWNFNRLRGINLMLANAYRVDAPRTQIDPYVGEALFFRAYFYFNLVKTYGDVPWIGKPITTTDTEYLYMDRSPRSLVVGSILSDLQLASTYLPERASAGSRINKEAALIFKSRIALYEGTWHKYHSGTDFGVQGSNGAKYLEIAANAALDLINLGTIELYSTGNPESDYESLFNSTDLSDVSEAILYRDFSQSLNTGHNVQNRILAGHGFSNGLSKSLVESFLCTDGKPISISPLYEGDNTVLDEVKNRDPRLRQIMYLPGDLSHYDQSGNPVYVARAPIDQTGDAKSTTGYVLRKGRDFSHIGSQHYASETQYVYFRYAEALLNYAEAKAELGTVTQGDIDLSINKIRSRAGMPNLVIANIPADPNWEFPDLSPVINEIRRERRVELACEGYRADDLFRWRAHHLIVGKRPKGAKFDPILYPEPGLQPGAGLIFTDGDGYIDYYQILLPNGWGFSPDRDYLYAIPPLQITLNNNLSQNPGWN